MENGMMELKKVIKLLKELPEDAGLNYEENWDDSQEVQAWRRESIKALEFAVKALQKGETIGSLNINGKEYRITK
jgi:hypothetical protein